MIKKRILIYAVMLMLLLTGCKTEAPLIQESFMMDTAVNLKIYGAGADAALSELNRTLAVFDRDFSHTRADSELYKLNHRTAPTVTVSANLRDILNESLFYARKTGGAFDPTIQPAVELWGIGTKNERIPSSSELNAALTKIDYTKIKLNGNSLTLPVGFSLNLGAIAKGYASQIASEILAKYNIPRAVLSFGGNIYVRGLREDNTPWHVGVRDPDGGENDILGIISATDEFIISSGDYERFFIRNGVRYHHILDPEFARPAVNDLHSVIIVGKNGTQGDAYSTALFVMGFDRALEFWREHHDFDAVFVLKNNKIVITQGLSGRFKLSDGGRYSYEIAER